LSKLFQFELFLAVCCSGVYRRPDATLQTAETLTASLAQCHDLTLAELQRMQVLLISQGMYFSTTVLRYSADKPQTLLSDLQIVASDAHLTLATLPKCPGLVVSLWNKSDNPATASTKSSAPVNLSSAVAFLQYSASLVTIVASTPLLSSKVLSKSRFDDLDTRHGLHGLIVQVGLASSLMSDDAKQNTVRHSWKDVMSKSEVPKPAQKRTISQPSIESKRTASLPNAKSLTQEPSYARFPLQGDFLLKGEPKLHWQAGVLSGSLFGVQLCSVQCLDSEKKLIWACCQPILFKPAQNSGKFSDSKDYPVLSGRIVQLNTGCLEITLTPTLNDDSTQHKSQEKLQYLATAELKLEWQFLDSQFGTCYATEGCAHRKEAETEVESTQNVREDELPGFEF
jgi:hypothetical protein